MGRSNYNGKADNDWDAEASLVNRPEVNIDKSQEPMQEEGITAGLKEEINTPAFTDVTHSNNLATLKTPQTDTQFDFASPNTVASASPLPVSSDIPDDDAQLAVDYPFLQRPRSDTGSTTSTESSTDSIKELRERIKTDPVFAKQVEVLMRRLSITKSEPDETSPSPWYNDSMTDNPESGRVLNLDGVPAKLESKGEAASGASIVDTSELDETSSIKSDAKSVLDESDFDSFRVPCHRAPKLELNSEAPSGGSIVGMSELDDTSSIQSYNDSIFDDVESVLSSVSSLGIDTQTVFVGAFVDLLLRDPSVDRMIARATSDAGIGAERFRGSFSRILKTYSRDLRKTMSGQQQKEQKHQLVAAFISRKTIRASSLVVTRYKERTPKSNYSALDKVGQYLDGLESDNSDSSDDEEPDAELTIAGLEAFLLQGKPFKALKWHLRSLIIPNSRVTQVKASAEHLLDFMFRSLGLEDTFERACKRVPNFNEWLRLKINDLAASLEIELKARHPVAEYLRTYSAYLSAQAVRKLRQKPDVSCAQNSDSSSCREQEKMQNTELRPPEEILEDIMAESLPGVFGGDFSQQNTWSRLLSTQAFRGFFSDLSDAAYPTFFSECRKALKAEIDSEVLHPSAQSEERCLLSILMELQWCSARHSRKFSFSIESPDSMLWVDRLKLAVEQSTGSQWSWWPLSPPPRAESKAPQLEPLDLHRLMPSKGSSEPSRSQEEQADCAKVLSWRCKCGSTRRELVSPKYATLFQQLASKYPTAHYDNNPIQLNRLSVPQTPSQSSSGGSSSSADTQSLDGSDSTEAGSSRASVSTAPSSAGSTAITLGFDTQAFIHLLVRKSDRYVMSSMNVTEKDARRFFQDLVVCYHQHRGLLRRIFSIFVYSHCDFVKVKRHRAHRFSPIPGFSFPELGRDIEYHEYTFSPKPMIQAPITKHMFNDFFYSCYDSHNLKHTFLHKLLSSCDVIETLPSDLLENMPKRDREVMAGARFSKVEHFWGIVAREQRSALRVVVYMLLSLVPTIWFTFMWLFSWGHEGDLQTATVPVTISIATLSMVWAVVYSDGGMDDK